ncbi:MAG: OmpA family protein [Cyanobacteria bacterium J06560_2]
MGDPTTHIDISRTQDSKKEALNGLANQAEEIQIKQNEITEATTTDSDTAQDDVAEDTAASQLAASQLAANQLAANQLAANQLAELRALLLGGPLEEVLNPKPTPEDISRLLPAAVSDAYDKKAGIRVALLPAVETAIQSSVQGDAAILAEALFPVIGPATRKSITASIGSLVESLNQALEHSLSPQSFKWRLEARRTGKTFAEVVLIRTLVYQVEQVFLIHKETGLMIQHVVTESATARDPDLVSAMLTAIQDFVKDSFVVDGERSLDTLKLGDFSLLIEDGPQAILAGVVRGTPPQELRALLRSQIETIHRTFGASLKTFDGDQDRFAGTRPYLEDCVSSKFKGKADKAEKAPISRRTKIIAWGLAGMLVSGIGLWMGMNWQRDRQWHRFVSTLQAEPGVVVISEQKKRGAYHLQGLLDPLAQNPMQLLDATKLNPNRVNMSWNPYLSLEPGFLQNRTQTLLSPPDTVSLTLNEQGVLQISGEASERWIQWAKATSAGLEGITEWQDADLISTERQALSELQSRIEYRRFVFPPGKAELRSQQYQITLQHQAEDIQKLLQLSEELGEPATISIVGHGDQRGQTRQVVQLGSTRASMLKNVLVGQGISPTLVTAEGTAIEDSSRLGAGDRDEDAAAYMEVHF